MKRYIVFLILIIPAILMSLGGLSMAHGSPDYGPREPKSTTYSSHDLAELAARLGSIVTFDRRGNVVWFDDFEDNINKWTFETPSAPEVCELSTTSARNGAKSCKIVTSADSGSLFEIYRYIPLPTTTKVGFELSYNLISNVDYFQHDIYLRDGTNGYLFRARYNLTDTTLQLLKADGTYTNLTTTLDLPVLANLFNTFKLVVDTDTKAYVRLIVNDVEYDISAYSGLSSVSALAPYLSVTSTVFNTDDGSATIYIDDCIITQNE